MHWGRRYFAVQAVAGAIWWVAVFLSTDVRAATLGSLPPVLVAAADIPLFVVGSTLAAFGLRWAATVATVWTIVVALSISLYATITTEAGWGALVMWAAAGGSVVALSLVVYGRVPTHWIVSGPFAFRAANPRSSTLAHLATTFAQVAGFWGLFLVIVPLILRAFEQRWQISSTFAPVFLPIGITVLVLSSALGLWSGVTMSLIGRGTPLPSAMPNALVIAGPYRFVRNPMAVAGIVQGVAVGFIVSSWFVVVYAIVGSVLWNFAVRPHEEADLEKRFGDEFRAYRSAVTCWVPRRPRVEI